MREIFFANESLAPRRGRTVHGRLPALQERPRARGRVQQHARRRQRPRRSTSCTDRSIWTPDRFAVTHADADMLGGRTRFSYSIAPLGTPGGSTQTFDADYTDLDLAGIGQLVNLESLAMTGRATGAIALDWPSGQISHRTTREGSHRRDAAGRHGRRAGRSAGAAEAAGAGAAAVRRQSPARPDRIGCRRRLRDRSGGLDVHRQLGRHAAHVRRASAAGSPRLAHPSFHST